MKNLANDQQVAHFSLATSEKWNDKDGERQERTEWHNLVVWDKLAGICGQYLKKGELIYVEGRIQSRDYEDKEGNQRRVTEIVIHEMKMLGGRRDGQTAAAEAAPDTGKDERSTKKGRRRDQAVA